MGVGGIAGLPAGWLSYSPTPVNVLARIQRLGSDSSKSVRPGNPPPSARDSPSLPGTLEGTLPRALEEPIPWALEGPFPWALERARALEGPFPWALEGPLPWALEGPIPWALQRPLQINNEINKFNLLSTSKHVHHFKMHQFYMRNKILHVTEPQTIQKV